MKISALEVAVSGGGVPDAEMVPVAMVRWVGLVIVPYVAVPPVIAVPANG